MKTGKNLEKQLVGTRVMLGVIAFLLAGNLVVNMTEGGRGRTAVAAGIPDSGAQMQAIVDQLTELNKRVDKLQSYVESGKMTVNVKDPKGEK
jgi:hypothetical protein